MGKQKPFQGTIYFAVDGTFTAFICFACRVAHLSFMSDCMKFQISFFLLYFGLLYEIPLMEAL